MRLLTALRALRPLPIALLVVGPVALSGCGPGPYGFAVKYAPRPDEEAAAVGARDYDPVMAVRAPEEWRGKKASLFGVVTGRVAGPQGGAYLTLSLRRLQARNLCDSNNEESTCRVTVSATDFGVVHALATFHGEDDVGDKAVRLGSLLRLVGTMADEPDTLDGQPVLRATYYRHWPRSFYVTSAAAGTMRQ